MSEEPSDLIPCSIAEIVAAATARGLTIPPECMKGVADNLALLARHAETLRGSSK